MNEFDLIKKYFVPLAQPFSGSLSLRDDAAILSIPAGNDLVVTKDAISEDVHYFSGTDPLLIAKKLLRTNLSDLAAMGAEPHCYFLSLALPSLAEDFIARFAQGLAEDQQQFGIYLAGGDTIATRGTPVFSLTAHGLVPKGQIIKRSGAKSGDLIYVSGTLGDAALGLARVQCPVSSVQEDDFLVRRYLLPEPRLSLGKALRGIATSCIDVSDGLLQDMGHVCAASHVGAEIDLETLPLSEAAKKMLAKSPECWPLIYGGGDDYELLFTLPPGAQAPAGTTKIGQIIEGSAVLLLQAGKEMPVTKTGYSH